MGCTASKGAANGSNNNPPLITKTVDATDKEAVSENSQLNASVSNNKKDTHGEEVQRNSSVVNIDSHKTANADTREESSLASSTVTFVKRKETDEDAEADALSLHDALHGLDNFTVVEIIRILAGVEYNYRQSVRAKFEEKFQMCLVDKIVVIEERSLETALRNLVRSQSECLADYLHDSVKTNNVKMLVEILTAWPADVLIQAKEIYKQVRRVTLNEDISHAFSEKMPVESKSMLLSLSTLERAEETEPIDEAVTSEECEEMSQSERAIIDVLTSRKHSLRQLSSIFSQFKAKYYLDIAESIEIEFQDETEVILKTITNLVGSIPRHFAQELKEMFHKSSVNKDRVAYILITRQPVDLSLIVDEYDKATDGSLVEDINKNLKGHYRDFLKLIIERAKLQ